MRLSPAFGCVPPIPLYSWKKKFYAKSCTPFAESLQAGQHLMIHTLCTKAKSPCGGFEFYERKKNLELLYDVLAWFVREVTKWLGEGTAGSGW